MKLSLSLKLQNKVKPETIYRHSSRSHLKPSLVIKCINKHKVICEQRLYINLCTK